MRDAAIAIGQIEMYLTFLEFQARGEIKNIFLARSHANNIMLVRPLILRKPCACSLAWATDTNGHFSQQLTEGGSSSS